MSRPAAHMAIAEISFERLADLLQLPVGVRVVGLQWDPQRDSVIFKIEGEGLPLVRPGEVLYRVEPTLHAGPPRIEWPKF